MNSWPVTEIDGNVFKLWGVRGDAFQKLIEIPQSEGLHGALDKEGLELNK